MFPGNNNSSGGHNPRNQNQHPNSNSNNTNPYLDINGAAKALLSLNIPLQTLPLRIQHPPPPPQSATKPRPHPDFYHVQTHLSRPLVPLVSIATGLPHPSFPNTILQYNLLTSTQLDELALHYHQTRPPTLQTFQYPIRVPSWVGEDVPVETKRRRLGRFIGLRGCESPTTTAAGAGAWGEGEGEVRMETEEEILERMEREWEEALRKARSEDDERLLRWKAGGI